MSYKILIPQDISRGGKQYLLDRGYEIKVDNVDGEINLKTVGEYDGILLRTAQVNKAVLDAAVKLKVIGRYGVGLDNIDLNECRRKGVKVTSAPYGNILSVAEYTMLMILQCAKNTYEVQGLWRSSINDFNSRNTHCGIEIAGRTLGIIGTGKIGTLVAKKAMHGFDMKVVAYDPYLSVEKRVEGAVYTNSLEELLVEADFITLHVPLTDTTRYLIRREQLGKMKKSAFLINASRGGTVDEQALIETLNQGTIAGAALDVFEHEPEVWPNPLFDMKNVIVSPHTAGMTVESSSRVGIHAAMGIDDILYGREPEWPVI